MFINKVWSNFLVINMICFAIAHYFWGTYVLYETHMESERVSCFYWRIICIWELSCSVEVREELAGLQAYLENLSQLSSLPHVLQGPQRKCFIHPPSILFSKPQNKTGMRKLHKAALDNWIYYNRNTTANRNLEGMVWLGRSHQSQQYCPRNLISRLS